MKRTRLKPGRRKPRSEADKERWESAWLPYCVPCGIRPTHTLHHVVLGQHIRSEGGDEWDPDNALPVCRECHDDHHGAVRRIPFGALLRRNREFAWELLGLAAGDYFDRYYPPTNEEAA